MDAVRRGTSLRGRFVNVAPAHSLAGLRPLPSPETGPFVGEFFRRTCAACMDQARSSHQLDVVRQHLYSLSGRRPDGTGAWKERERRKLRKKI